MNNKTISATEVKKLRDQTGAGMMDCKKALMEADGDFDQAVENLRKKGQKVSDKRAEREAKEGVVIAVVNDKQDKGIVIKLSCETDFVAKTDSFIDLAKRIGDHALTSFPSSREELIASNFEGKALSETILEQVAVIGEKIELANYEKLVAPLVVSYIHMGYKAGVILGLNNDAKNLVETGRNTAMQVAAMKPIAVDESGVDASMVQKEIEIGKEQARLEGKPENLLDRIAQGKLQKFYKENTLLNQAYVKDGKMSVAQYLNSVEKGLSVTDFKHVKLG